MMRLLPNFNQSSDKELAFLPFLECGIMIISKELKKIFEANQAGLKFKPIALANTKMKMMNMHYFIEPKEVDCLGNKTEYIRSTIVKNIWLDPNKIGYNKVFKIKGVDKNHIVVDLEIVEKMFQANINEFAMVKIDVEEV